MGVRPFGFHAGNIASTIVYLDLLCKSLKKINRTPEFHVYFCLSDTEQESIVGHYKDLHNDDEANIYPEGRTLQFSTWSKDPNYSVVDAWTPLYVNALKFITDRWPSITWDIYRTSELKECHEFKNVLIRAMKSSEEIANIVEVATGKKAHKPADYVRAICPSCCLPSATCPNGESVEISCYSCGLETKGEYYAFDYWTHHAIAIMAEWASLPKFDLAICGYDHYSIGSERLWDMLGRFFDIEDKVSMKKLYAPLMLSYDGKKMGKSNGNARYAHFEVISHFCEASSGHTMQIPNGLLSENIRSTGFDVPSVSVP